MAVSGEVVATSAPAPEANTGPSSSTTSSMKAVWMPKNPKASQAAKATKATAMPPEA